LGGILSTFYHFSVRILSFGANFAHFLPFFGTNFEKYTYLCGGDLRAKSKAKTKILLY